MGTANHHQNRKDSITMNSQHMPSDIVHMKSPQKSIWSSCTGKQETFHSQKYQTEQQELIEKIDRLKTELASEKKTAADAEKWIALIKQYSEPAELTAEMLNTLIEKIVIHEATKDSDGTRAQELEIYYRFVGKLD